MTILEEAAKITSGDRNSDYGHPAENHQCTAELFGTYIERKHGARIRFDVNDVCYFNMLQKISRGAQKTTRDTLVDIAGYARNIEMGGDVDA